MARFEEPRVVLAGSVRSGRLWLLQFFLNPILFGLFAAWLLIPEAKSWQLGLNALLALAIVVAALVLQAGTLNYFSDQFREGSAAVRSSFGRALRHIPAVALAALILCLLWALAGMLDRYHTTLPIYVRSTFPASLRRFVSVGFLSGAFDATIFLLQWVVVPALLLPLVLIAADKGFRGLNRSVLKTWKATILSTHYWIILVAAAFLGVYVSNMFLGWRTSSEHPTFASETANLILRLLLAYGLALFSWMLACALVGRRGGSVESIAGNASA